MCGHHAQNLFVLRSPQLSGPWRSCGRYAGFSPAGKGSAMLSQSKHWSGGCRVCRTCSAAPEVGRPTANLVIVFETFKRLNNLKAWLRFAPIRDAGKNFFASYCMYSFSRCSVKLRDTNTNCVIGSLAIYYGIRLWLMWAVVYVVTFAQTY